jgi:hypothetical protein
MRIIKVLILKKLENEEMYSRAMRIQFAYEEHISAYLHALSYLGFEDKELNKKIKLWKRFVNYSGDNQMRIFKKLLVFRIKEDEIIMRALNKIEEQKESDYGIMYGALYQPFTWGILSYEFDTGE